MTARSAKPRRTAFGLLAAALLCAGAPVAATAQDLAPISVVIQQSPWFEGFRGITEAYEEATGNAVELDVNPYAGSLEKQRNAVRAERSQFDLLIVNGLLYAEMYAGGFLTPLNEIDPDFRLDPQIYTYDDTLWYDAETGITSAETGDLLTVPVNPNVPILFYRQDLYEEAGLEVPKTWEQLLANAKALHNPPERYGIVQRGARAAISVTWDYWPYLLSYGGDLFADRKAADYTVVLNSPEAKEALDFYIRLSHEAGHPNTASLAQSDLLQNILTGRAAHSILPAAAWSQMDDPNKSAVVGKIGFANLPGTDALPPAPPLGHWLAGIPRNIPDENKKAALAFLDWFQQPEQQVLYAKLGGAPVSAAAYETDFAEQPENRWMQAMRDAAPMARQMVTIPEGAEIIAVMEVSLNRAIAGEIDSSEALNTMAREIRAIVEKAGYRTGGLPDLP